MPHSNLKMPTADPTATWQLRTLPTRPNAAPSQPAPSQNLAEDVIPRHLIPFWTLIESNVF